MSFSLSFNCPFMFPQFPFMSFHFLSCPFIFLLFTCGFLSIPFICFHVPWISLGSVIWEKPRKHMETPMSPRFSAPDSIQLTFSLGGGLVLEILLFLSFFHLCVGALFLFIFQSYPLMFLDCVSFRGFRTHVYFFSFPLMLFHFLATLL